MKLQRAAVRGRQCGGHVGRVTPWVVDVTPRHVISTSPSDTFDPQIQFVMVTVRSKTLSYRKQIEAVVSGITVRENAFKAGLQYVK